MNIEWPDGTRIEVPGENCNSLYYRDDAHGMDDERHWHSLAGCSASTWAELAERHGDALDAAVPLYPPSQNRPVALRPVHAVLGTAEGGEPYVWCFTDGDDAREAYARGCGDRIIPTVVFGPDVLPQVVRVYTGWARIGRGVEDDSPPDIVREMDMWLVPGPVPDLVETGSDQAGGFTLVGVDVLDIFATGPSRDAVLRNLDGRYDELRGARSAAIGWHAAPESLLM